MRQQFWHLPPTDDPATQPTWRGYPAASFEAVMRRMDRPPPLLRGSLALSIMKSAGQATESPGGPEPLVRPHQ